MKRSIKLLLALFAVILLLSFSTAAFAATVQGSPPVIYVPEYMIVTAGTWLDLYCGATDPDGGSLEYLWYETPSGKLEDIIAINRGTETSDTLHCDTDTVGIRYYVCMVTTSSGGMAYSSVIPVTVLEHKHVFGPWMVTTQPTCTEEGIKARECDCGHTERAGIPATGHTFGDWMVTTKPTCTEEGIKARECDCGHTERAGIPATGHQFGEWMVTTKPTCTEEGIKARECDCGNTERAGIPVTGHRWDNGTVTKKATEKADGEKIFTCTVCQATKVEKIKYTGAGVQPTEDTTEITETTEAPETTEGPETTAATEETTTEPGDTDDAEGATAAAVSQEVTKRSGVTWWAIALIAVGVAGLGACGVVAFLKLRKH